MITFLDSRVDRVLFKNEVESWPWQPKSQPMFFIDQFLQLVLNHKRLWTDNRTHLETFLMIVICRVIIKNFYFFPSYHYYVLLFGLLKWSLMIKLLKLFALHECLDVQSFISQMSQLHHKRYIIHHKTRSQIRIFAFFKTWKCFIFLWKWILHNEA